MPARTNLVAGLLLIACTTGPAFAQQPSDTRPDPNADAIVKALTPSRILDGQVRGFRIATPTLDAGYSLTIQFASGSAALTPEATRDLDDLGVALGDQRLPAYHFRVEGHTDTVGAPDRNKTLSQRRAQAVVTYLAAKYRIDPARLQAVGLGEEGLLVATPDQTPEVRNRRVLVMNVGS